MAYNDLQEPLKALSSVLDHVIGEAVREDLSGQRWNGDPRALALQDVAKVLKVRITTADHGVAQFEGRDIGSSVDLI